MTSPTPWQLPPPLSPPAAFQQAVGHSLHQKTDDWSTQITSQLLWQRGIPGDQVSAFLNPADYPPTDAFAFGVEMQRAIERLQQAQAQSEKVLIWGDFDADGLTATAVLWEGLGRIFAQGEHLGYYVPHRFTESHGLSHAGLERFQAEGYRLIVTCDTGCSQLEELAYAQALGFDVIVTDHHTLPASQPPVIAMINPRTLPQSHPLANLSGVAVAYKLIEALYQTLGRPPADLLSLLDLVAIGLIADLVQLTGECRYLAQQGLRQLNPKTRTAPTPARPGLKMLLDYCKASGDRPTDISFGIAPRINAVSRIHGDAHFVIDLLTSSDPSRCQPLAEAAELANTRRKGLQQQLVQEVERKISQLDLASTPMLVLHDPQWPIGILGLVAGQITQTYHRPTLLLTNAQLDDVVEDAGTVAPLARGSARSMPGLDLYQLIESQHHLLAGFGGHPLALGLSLPPDNIPILREALNREVITVAASTTTPPISADLVVTVAALERDKGRGLFQALAPLEPYGMGNSVPRLCILNCEFREIQEDRYVQDRRGKRTPFPNTRFQIWDQTAIQGFAGVWWGHGKQDIPRDRCDAIVELDFRPHPGKYEVRLVAVRPHDVRSQRIAAPIADDPPTTVHRCTPPPASLDLPQQSPVEQWQKWLGLAKYLSRTQIPVQKQTLAETLAISDPVLEIGLDCLVQLGFQVGLASATDPNTLKLSIGCLSFDRMPEIALHFIQAVQEDHFRHQYAWTQGFGETTL